MARIQAKRKRDKQAASTQGELLVTALYLRVSTKDQVEKFGLDAQRSELDDYCRLHGWTVSEDHIYVDAGISGKSTDRPAFKAMMQAAQEGHIQRIVATKLDRIARNLKDLLTTVDELKSYSCALVIKKEQFDTSTPQGMFVLQMLGAVAELERSMISERVSGGRIEKAKTGGYLGSRCPLGYTYQNGEFVVNASSAQVVKDIFDGFINGESLSGLADCLNVNETPTAMGGKWYPSTIRTILDNGAYAGLSQWNGLEAQEGVYPAIITKDTYEAAHKRLQALRPGKQKV